MAFVHSKPLSDLHSNSSRNTITSTMTREDLMALAQNEYARQLCKFTEAQLKRNVPCYTEQQKLGMATLSSVKAAQH
ncbi:uncharacterized protein EV154DRAFT_517630 [Mucor mucedo]|uniref:Uncharacterized protein n=1 Tax=Mucor saturninus TaxID=64648 RepID=A0A8H7UZE2_9FUNG|nr:uncharacterized protein EV154DRAFT_517630 [Mucor mucedo]KAG2195999.1 hypothetical protein INT47_011504 [Mucor saturninus]KAI7888495.1 hypothetical protein EV154DRAFT_517630 [Mucor mucedo]